MYMSYTIICSDKKGRSDQLEVGLQAVISHYVGVLGTKPRYY